MVSKDYLVGITVKNKNKDKIRVMLPCEEENNTFFEILDSLEQEKLKAVNIYSKCGIKVLEGKYQIVGINDDLYKDKEINKMTKDEFKDFVILLNNYKMIIFHYTIFICLFQYYVNMLFEKDCNF